MSCYIRLASKSGESDKIVESLKYIHDQRKTLDNLYQSANLSSESAYEDMMVLKKLFLKTGGRQLLHWVISHDENVSTEQADVVAREVIELLAGKYQVCAATHINTNNRHTHFLINPVDIKTGKKFSESKNDMLNFRDKLNKILVKYGLNTIDEKGVLEMGGLEWDQHYESQKISSKKRGTYGTSGTYGTWNPEINSEKKELVRGVFYDDPNTFSLVKYEENKKFLGKGCIEDGNLLTPGILYEVTE